MSLTPEQIANLTRKDDIKQGSHKSRWISPADAKVVLASIAERNSRVIIGGEHFIIKYKEQDRVFIKPAKPGKFSPCGEYTTSLLRSIAA